MKLILKQRLLSWFGSYNIYDENDNIIFIVRGEVSWGHQVRIYNNNLEVGFIREKIFRILPKFILYDNNNNEIGMVCREFKFFKHKYSLTCNDWIINGDYLGWNFEIVDGRGNIIARTKKNIFHLAAQYEIDVFDPRNSLLVLEIFLSIDLENCTANRMILFDHLGGIINK